VDEFGAKHLPSLPSSILDFGKQFIAARSKQLLFRSNSLARADGGYLAVIWSLPGMFGNSVKPLVF